MSPSSPAYGFKIRTKRDLDKQSLRKLLQHRRNGSIFKNKTSTSRSREPIAIHFGTVFARVSFGSTPTKGVDL